LTIDTYTYNYTNMDTDTDIHPIIVVARVLALTHTAKDCFEDVRRVVVIIVTLCVIVQSEDSAPAVSSTGFGFYLPAQSHPLYHSAAESPKDRLSGSYFDDAINIMDDDDDDDDNDDDNDNFAWIILIKILGHSSAATHAIDLDDAFGRPHLRL